MSANPLKTIYKSNQPIQSSGHPDEVDDQLGKLRFIVQKRQEDYSIANHYYTLAQNILSKEDNLSMHVLNEATKYLKIAYSTYPLDPAKQYRDALFEVAQKYEQIVKSETTSGHSNSASQALQNAQAIYALLEQTPSISVEPTVEISESKTNNSNQNEFVNSIQNQNANEKTQAFDQNENIKQFQERNSNIVNQNENLRKVHEENSNEKTDSFNPNKNITLDLVSHSNDRDYLLAIASNYSKYCQNLLDSKDFEGSLKIFESFLSQIQIAKESAIEKNSKLNDLYAYVLDSISQIYSKMALNSSDPNQTEKHYSKALQYCNEAIILSDNNRDYRLTRAQLYFSMQQNFEQAITDFDYYLKTKPGTFSLNVFSIFFAIDYLVQDMFNPLDVNSYYNQKFLEIDAQLKLAHCLSRVSKLVLSQKAYEKALNLISDLKTDAHGEDASPQIVEIADRLRKNCKSQMEVLSYEFLAKGDEYAKSAFTHYENYKSSVDAVYVNFTNGEIELSDDNEKSAFMYFEKLQTDAQTAQWYYNRALSLDEKNAYAYFGIGQINSIVGECELKNQEVLKYKSEVPGGLYYNMRLRSTIEHLKYANSNFKKAFELFWGYYCEANDLLLSNFEPTRKNMLSMNKTFDEIYEWELTTQLLGYAYLYEEKSQEAKTYFEFARSLSQNPNSYTDAINQLSKQFLQKARSESSEGFFEHSEKNAQTSLELNPNQWNSYFRIGEDALIQAQKQSGRDKTGLLQKSIVNFSKSLEFAQNEDLRRELHSHMSKAYFELGDQKNALLHAIISCSDNTKNAFAKKDLNIQDVSWSSDNLMAYEQLAKMLYETSDWQNANTAIQHCINLDPSKAKNYLEISVNAADNYLKIGKSKIELAEKENDYFLYCEGASALLACVCTSKDYPAKKPLRLKEILSEASKEVDARFTQLKKIAQDASTNDDIKGRIALLFEENASYQKDNKKFDAYYENVRFFTSIGMLERADYNLEILQKLSSTKSNKESIEYARSNLVSEYEKSAERKHNASDYAGALKEFDIALDLLSQNKLADYSQSKSSILVKKASTNIALGNFAIALENITMADEILGVSSEQSQKLSLELNTILQDAKNAETFFLQWIELANQKNLPKKDIAIAYANLANVRFELLNFEQSAKDADHALSLISDDQNEINISREPMLISAYLTSAKSNFELENYSDALKNVERYISLAQGVSAINEVADAYVLRAKLFAKQASLNGSSQSKTELLNRAISDIENAKSLGYVGNDALLISCECQFGLGNYISVYEQLKSIIMPSASAHDIVATQEQIASAYMLLAKLSNSILLEGLSNYEYGHQFYSNDPQYSSWFASVDSSIQSKIKNLNSGEVEIFEHSGKKYGAQKLADGTLNVYLIPLYDSEDELKRRLAYEHILADSNLSFHDFAKNIHEKSIELNPADQTCIELKSKFDSVCTQLDGKNVFDMLSHRFIPDYISRAKMSEFETLRASILLWSKTSELYELARVRKHRYANDDDVVSLVFMHCLNEYRTLGIFNAEMMTAYSEKETNHRTDNIDIDDSKQNFKNGGTGTYQMTDGIGGGGTITVVENDHQYNLNESFISLGIREFEQLSKKGPNNTGDRYQLKNNPAVGIHYSMSTLKSKLNSKVESSYKKKYILPTKKNEKSEAMLSPNMFSDINLSSRTAYYYNAYPDLTVRNDYVQKFGKYYSRYLARDASLEQSTSEIAYSDANYEIRYNSKWSAGYVSKEALKNMKIDVYQGGKSPEDHTENIILAPAAVSGFEQSVFSINAAFFDGNGNAEDLIMHDGKIIHQVNLSKGRFEKNAHIFYVLEDGSCGILKKKEYLKAYNEKQIITSENENMPFIPRHAIAVWPKLMENGQAISVSNKTSDESTRRSFVIVTDSSDAIFVSTKAGYTYNQIYDLVSEIESEFKVKASDLLMFDGGSSTAFNFFVDSNSENVSISTVRQINSFIRFVKID